MKKHTFEAECSWCHKVVPAVLVKHRDYTKLDMHECVDESIGRGNALANTYRRNEVLHHKSLKVNPGSVLVVFQLSNKAERYYQDLADKTPRVRDLNERRIVDWAKLCTFKADLIRDSRPGWLCDEERRLAPLDRFDRYRVRSNYTYKHQHKVRLHFTQLQQFLKLAEDTSIRDKTPSKIVGTFLEAIAHGYLTRVQGND